MPTGSRGSSLPAPPRAVRRRALSPAVMTVFSLVGAALVVASNSAVTPLYRLYQQSMHLTPLMINLVYAVYTFSLLATLLTVGGLSDYVGRRPVILSGLLLNAIAMVLFSYATDVGQLILARAVQGLCVGTATPVLGAVILDTDHRRGPLLNSVTAFLGLTAGALGAAALVTFAPDPLHLVYEVLFALTALMMVLLFVMPETVSRKAGALASLRPRVSVPRQSRAALLRVTPASIAAWAFGGFYLSLMPTDGGGDDLGRPRALGRWHRRCGALVVRRANCGSAPTIGCAPVASAGYRRIVAGRCRLAARHLAAQRGRLVRRCRDRRSWLGRIALRLAARAVADRRSASARRLAGDVLCAVLSRPRPAGAGRGRLGAADRAGYRGLCVRRGGHRARHDLDDRVTAQH